MEKKERMVLLRLKLKKADHLYSKAIVPEQ